MLFEGTGLGYFSMGLWCDLLYQMSLPLLMIVGLGLASSAEENILPKKG